MQSYVGISRIGVETLSQHQRRFLVFVSGSSEERNVGRQDYVAGNLFPCELESVGGEPHVFATAADRVGFLGRIISDRARVQHRAHIAVTFEDSGGCLALRPGGTTGHGRNTTYKCQYL